jgi:hypothetical protein
VVLEAAVRSCSIAGAGRFGGAHSSLCFNSSDIVIPLVDWRKRVRRFRELKMVPQFVGRKGLLLETTVNVS